MTSLTEGEYVVKIGGSYQGLWSIRSIFTTLDGLTRCVAESVPADGEGLKGLLHIFTLEQMRRPSPEDPRVHLDAQPPPGWQPPTDPESDPMRHVGGPMA